ncbi:hypothetical protein [Campylobacter helveticus]|uniref:hypothetical protein n=1 Tax=Campylobacter helveticus TaxID=28898 RepID=UPI0022EA2EBC|nr:hypothetical protein [Campylobacter helveticus]
MFDEKRFKAFKDFLFFINTHLEKDALQKDIKGNIFSDVVPYINALFGGFLGFSYLYTREILENFTCKFNNPKTVAILNKMEKLDETAGMIIK